MEKKKLDWPFIIHSARRENDEWVWSCRAMGCPPYCTAKHTDRYTAIVNAKKLAVYHFGIQYAETGKWPVLTENMKSLQTASRVSAKEKENVIVETFPIYIFPEIYKREISIQADLLYSIVSHALEEKISVQEYLLNAALKVIAGKEKCK